MKSLWKLLRQHISPAQLTGFFLSGIIGMTIILTGVQLYKDLIPIFGGGESFIKKDYLIVTKNIHALHTLFGNNNSFTPAEVDRLRQQSFVKKADGFIPSGFDVRAGISMPQFGVHLGTEMFFESVPDTYIDTDLSQWEFDPDNKTIPIILPRNYLQLYNFGFAPSRGLPKLSENMVEAILLDIRLTGKGNSEHFSGKIAGFSDRLNTILVPETFMKWANDRFAESSLRNPVRLIAEITNPADKEMTEYFLKQGYEIENSKLDTGKTAWFLRLVISLVLGIGVIISLLSFYILMLSIYLLLQKNRIKLQNLHLIGYQEKEIARPYQILTWSLNAGVFLLASAIALFLRQFYIKTLKQLWPDYQESDIYFTLFAGLLLFLFISLIDSLIIQRKIRQIGNFHSLK